MILLDTHVLVWWLGSPARLPARVRRRLDALVSAGDPALVSAISAWEIAMLVERGRLELTMAVEAWVGHAGSLPFIRFVPVDPAIAVASASLPGFPHGDPADRMIVATAVRLGATLVTADQRLQRYRGVTTLWGGER